MNTHSQTVQAALSLVLQSSCIWPNINTFTIYQPISPVLLNITTGPQKDHQEKTLAVCRRVGIFTGQLLLLPYSFVQGHTTTGDESLTLFGGEN